MRSLMYLFILTLITSCQPQGENIYVSPSGNRLNQGTRQQPVATLNQALQVMTEMRKQGDRKEYTILFEAGNYEFTEPITIGLDHLPSSAYTLHISGLGKEKVSFSGGKEVSDWEVKEGIWVASVAIEQGIEQLFVNGDRAIRARTPNKSASPNRWYLDSVRAVRDREGDIFLQTDLWLQKGSEAPLVSGAGETEIVVFKDWATLRHRVAGIDSASRRIALQPPFAFFDGNYNGLLASYVNRFTCYLEGHPSFIDQEGEWAYSQEDQLLYYYPRAGETIENTKVVVPVLESLLVVQGKPGQRLANLHLANIGFENIAYHLPSYGHDGRQACFYYSKGTEIPGDQAMLTEAIRMEWVENSTLENCQLRHTGGNGIYITRGCQNITMNGMTLEDIGGNGLMVGTASDPGLDADDLVKGIHFRKGSVKTAGQHYDSAVGIWLGFCRDCSVVGNEVFDLPYTGISVGWQWNPLPSSSGGNLIEDNHIHDVMQMLGDGGGIYTLGFQPGSVIRNNTIHDILRSELNHASPNNGLFIDEGSKGYLVDGNHIYRVSHTCIRGHRAAGVELRNNRFVSGDMAAVSHTPPYGSMIFANKDTVVQWPNPGWPKEWGYGDMVTAFTMNNNLFESEK